ncbi:dipeptidase PepV [Ligilactobacillus salitolerans]|uniref:Dipeptidase PepV n=1 Tax=Ligilactobacillus salitolerans TaxID=1808352 RepID=A0A401IR74_9LACO|nr:Sapep family Mn(2+)-dependent dipeptidase [Ligilactobacillus salitolerans]GBG94038.1 dipeptidase PepV [Ligilactobacillus salitolerans]
MERVEQEIADNLQHYQELLGQVIQIPSVKGAPTAQAPYGAGPKAALEQALEIARQLGLKTGQVANKVGWAQLDGQDDEYIAVLGHLDVVQAGENWTTPPYQLTVKDGYMYGRGVLDNKGPILGALFALSLLKKHQVSLKHSIRVIFGTDEESGSADIPAYLQAEKPPLGGFTPDGKYPVVYAERGMLRLQVDLPFAEEIAWDKISGNFAASYIPDAAEVHLKDGSVQDYVGKKSPSNAPELGDNVIRKIALDGQKLPGQFGKYLAWISQISADTTGENLGVAYQDESGELQLSLWGMELSAGLLQLSLTIRYPVTLQKEDLLQKLKQNLPAGAQLKVVSEVAPLLVDRKQPMIQIMQDVYEQVTHTDGSPVTTTGVTYARSLPNIVAFGPSFPGQRGIAHKENEWLKVSDWQKMIQIDYLAMKKLAQEL